MTSTTMWASDILHVVVLGKGGKIITGITGKMAIAGNYFEQYQVNKLPAAANYHNYRLPVI